MKLTFEPAKTRYFLGENIVVHLGVTNIDAEPFAISKGAGGMTNPLFMTFLIAAFDSEGNDVANAYTYIYHMKGLESSRTLKKGESWFNTISLLAHCDFKEPGIYKIRIRHEEPISFQPLLPDAEFQIELVMPTPEQARKVVEEFEATPKNKGVPDGEKNLLPLPDIGALSYPVYLPLLLERIDAGNLKYLRALENIDTPAATRALVERLKSPEPTATTVVGVLKWRLPGSDYQRLISNKPVSRDGKLGVWDEEFVPATREYALKALKSDSDSMMQTGCEMLESIGLPQDLPAVLTALNRFIALTVKYPEYPAKEHESSAMTGYQYRVDCHYLMRCDRALVRQGAVPPPVSKSDPASIAVRLKPETEYESQVPPAPQTEWLKHPIPFIRETTLWSLAGDSWLGRKVTIAPEVRALLPTLFKDSSTGVRIAACVLAYGGSRDASLLPPILKLLSKARNSSEIDCAQKAARSMGGQYQVWEIWANRLGEPSMLRPAIDSLVGVLKTGINAKWHDGEAESEGKLLKPRWQQFLKTNRERLKQGKLFSVDETGWPNDLFPKSFR